MVRDFILNTRASGLQLAKMTTTMRCHWPEEPLYKSPLEILQEEQITKICAPMVRYSKYETIHIMIHSIGRDDRRTMEI